MNAVKADNRQDSFYKLLAYFARCAENCTSKSGLFRKPPPLLQKTLQLVRGDEKHPASSASDVSSRWMIMMSRASRWCDGIAREGMTRPDVFGLMAISIRLAADSTSQRIFRVPFLKILFIPPWSRDVKIFSAIALRMLFRNFITSESDYCLNCNNWIWVLLSPTTNSSYFLPFVWCGFKG